ncbi:glycoside hydrolase family 30 protein [Acrocarpospora catenulata]|uniref:glycoside hydrolase family 30 protein n=1 Tax=Acrocarpospora catenulata TaxID=2836182 RepID=UPI0027E13DF5|nr:glycoside hydrolase [Acrocarpospora catenulata]
MEHRNIHQKIDGFGFSQAFRRNELIRQLSPQQQREILDLWLSKEKGAGLSILRLGIGSSATDSPYDLMWSIQPQDPGGPDAPPNYRWDGDDGSQVWLAKEAKRYGVQRFYADAWSAPYYMKDNESENNGGSLCGLTGVTCADGQDWRAAYARYLVQYAKFYKQEGIKITDIGFTNEPDWTATYASMRFTPAQAAEMVRVMGPYARKAGLNLVCCDSFGWTEQKAYTAAVEADPVARRYVDVYAGHTYASPVDGPQPTRRSVWMSEWNPNGDTWNVNWDDGSGWDGFTIASAVHDALVLGNANAYVYWFGASRGATRALLQVDVPNQTYSVSKRLWALAAYSRFIRPEAARLGISASDPALKVSAFRNKDGSEVVEILNTATTAVNTTLKTKPGKATLYLTDGGNSLAPSALPGFGPHRSLTLQPRSLTTVLVK